MKQVFFQQARPVWPAGFSQELHLTCAFTAQFAGIRALLRITGASLYRVYCNGRFVGYGPARAAHGYFRVDGWELDDYCGPGVNTVYIEVACYQVNSFYTLCQPPFLQAELVRDGEVLAATGADGGFHARLVPERVQKVQRYSFQRPFIEMWELSPGYYDGYYRQDAGLPLLEQEEKQYLPRGTELPEFRICPGTLIGRGAVLLTEPEHLYADRSLTEVGTSLKGYPRGELALVLSDWVQRLEFVPEAAGQLNCPTCLRQGEYALYELERDYCGFPVIELECRSETELCILFDELLIAGTVSFLRMEECVNALHYRLMPGRYRIEGFEAYVMKYLQLAVTRGDCTVLSVKLREYAASAGCNTALGSGDEILDRIYEAGVHVFRSNTVDTLMDDPSRERAGWLQDSFWTARAAQLLTGACRAERNFLENYLLGRFERIPPGMIPGCYPSEPFSDDFYVPTNALWLILQLQEYRQRSGDEELIGRFRERIYALLDFYRPYQNKLGLLERLPGWVFVEWSKANAYVNDINFPVNMLYCGALEAAAELYHDAALLERARLVREQVASLASKTPFFPDHAIWEEGKLRVPGDHSEICQYLAFFFNFADPSTDSELFELLAREFGPGRDATVSYPELCPCNVLFGYPLRLEMLYRAGCHERLREDIKGYYAAMAAENGSLWEHSTPDGSLNQAANAHVVYYLHHCR